MNQASLLVVDDDPTLRDVLTFDLKRKGYQVTEAENGQEALKFAKSNKVDLILSDVRMAGGDGITLLKDIKKLNARSPKVMLISGFSDITLEEAYDLGADAIFGKPFDRKELIRTVERMLKPRHEALAQKRDNQTHKIELSQPSALKFGRGGFFVALTGNFPPPGAIVGLQIQFAQATLMGQGTVRWTRPQDVLPGGCGIEIDYLEPECREGILRLTDALDSKPFIPRN